MFKDGRGSGLCKNENYANHAGSQVKWKPLESDEVKAKPKAMISFTVESSWFINIHIDFSKTYYSDIPILSLKLEGCIGMKCNTVIADVATYRRH